MNPYNFSNIITWLSIFRPIVPNIRSRYTVKAIGATINLDGIEASDVTGDITGKVVRIMDMILY